MAITIIQSASTVMPVYNPIYNKVSSNNIAQENFKYLFQVYTGETVTGNPVATVKLLPRPDTTCIFSPARILENFISYDTNIQNINSGKTSLYHITKYVVNIGEEYGSLITGTTSYPGLAFTSGHTFNGVLQYDEIPNWSWTGYQTDVSTSKFLTKQPRTGVYVKNTTDRGTLTFGQRDLTRRANKMLITTYNSTGTTTTSIWLGVTGNINHLPSGIWNINNIHPSHIISGATAGNIILADTYQYEIWLNDNHTPEVQITEKLMYLIDTNCSKYDTLRFQFKNSLGGFDYENMYLINRKKLSVKRNTFTKPLAYNYAVGDVGKQIIDIDAQYSNTIQSRVLTYSESIWLQELMWSSYVNLIDENGVSTPIIIDTDSIDLKPKSYNNKLYSITVNFSYANKINTSR